MINECGKPWQSLAAMKPIQNQRFRNWESAPYDWDEKKKIFKMTLKWLVNESMVNDMK